MKIALFGYGRMGKAIERIALERGHEIVLRKDLEPVDFDYDTADVAIDFSHPNAAYDNIVQCINHNLPVVSGTTGWLERFEGVKQHCEESGGAFLYASNFSIGVNIFFELNAYLARLMKKQDAYRVSMDEIHHIHKLDAPSGTAISLAEDIIGEKKMMGWSLENSSEDRMHIRVEREGEVPGTHAVHYDSEIDSIEIRHTAHNRVGFALGAVVAAEWIRDKKGVFSMKDVLDLR